MRCKCCDRVIQCLRKNKQTGELDDLCSSCLVIVRKTVNESEWVSQDDSDDIVLLVMDMIDDK